MALNPNDITTEITLELDMEEIPIDKFRKAVDEFIGLVKEVTKTTVPKKSPSAWLVKVYPGSAGIGLKRKPGYYTNEEVFTVRDNINNGLVLLEKGKRPEYFTDKAIEHSKKLGTLSYSKKIPAKVRLWGQSEKPPLVMTGTMSTTAIHLLGVAYEEDSSIDGILGTLTAHGRFEFVVYDLIDDRPITCEIGEDQIEEAWKSFRNRVEVTGIVRYRSDGIPVSIKVRDITPFPSKNEIPTPNEMRLLLNGN